MKIRKKDLKPLIDKRKKILTILGMDNTFNKFGCFGFYFLPDDDYTTCGRNINLPCQVKNECRALAKTKEFRSFIKHNKKIEWEDVIDALERYGFYYRY